MTFDITFIEMKGLFFSSNISSTGIVMSAGRDFLLLSPRNLLEPDCLQWLLRIKCLPLGTTLLLEEKEDIGVSGTHSTIDDRSKYHISFQSSSWQQRPAREITTR